MHMNENGGYFESSVPYSMGKKLDVLQAYLEIVGDKAPELTKILSKQVAKQVRVSKGCAHKVIQEYIYTGTLKDPKDTLWQLAEKKHKDTQIGPEVSIILLGLSQSGG